MKPWHFVLVAVLMLYIMINQNARMGNRKDIRIHIQDTNEKITWMKDDIKEMKELSKETEMTLSQLKKREKELREATGEVLGMYEVILNMLSNEEILKKMLTEYENYETIHQQ